MKCIFLGYANGELGYQLWDLVKNKVIWSRDLIFNELDMFKKIVGDMEFKKVVDRFDEKQKDIPPLL